MEAEVTRKLYSSADREQRIKKKERERERERIGQIGKLDYLEEQDDRMKLVSDETFGGIKQMQRIPAVGNNGSDRYNEGARREKEGGRRGGRSP